MKRLNECKMKRARIHLNGSFNLYQTDKPELKRIVKRKSDNLQNKRKITSHWLIVDKFFNSMEMKHTNYNINININCSALLRKPNQIKKKYQLFFR